MLQLDQIEGSTFVDLETIHSSPWRHSICAALYLCRTPNMNENSNLHASFHFGRELFQGMSSLMVYHRTFVAFHLHQNTALETTKPSQINRKLVEIFYCLTGSLGSSELRFFIAKFHRFPANWYIFSLPISALHTTRTNRSTARLAWARSCCPSPNTFS